MYIKYNQWWHETRKRVYKQRMAKKKLLLVVLILVGEFLMYKKRDYSTKQYWVNPVLQLRKKHGFYEAVYPTLFVCDKIFQNYMRMSPTQFQNLLQKVSPLISKRFVVREPISAEARLAMTLR